MDDNENSVSSQAGSETGDVSQPEAESEIAPGIEAAIGPTAGPASGGDAVVWTYLKMLKGIRSWGFWSLGLGVMHLISFGVFSAPWGVLLLVVGLASFYYHEAGMFVIYGATLAWAAVNNALSKELTWIIVAAFQVVMAVQVFRQYFRYRRAQADVIALPDEGTRAAILAPARAERAFPVIGCLFSALAVGGVPATFAGMLVAAAASGEREVPDYFNFVIGLVVIVAVLGLSVSLASVLSRYRYRVLGILGIIASAVVLILWVWLSVA